MSVCSKPVDTVFLDRDGTIIKECEYLSDPAGVQLLPGAAEGLKMLSDAGKKLIILTNQSGIGRGYFTQEQSDAVQCRVKQLLENEGVRIDGLFCCPHVPDAGCDCRKPKTGLAEQAANELGIDLTRCAMVGDKAIDIEMGKNINAVTVLLKTGYGKNEILKCQPDLFAESLLDTAQFLLGGSPAAS